VAPARLIFVAALLMSSCVLDYDALRRGRGVDASMMDAAATDAGPRDARLDTGPFDADAAPLGDAGAPCQVGAATCGDPLFCNGAEVCDPRGVGTDSNGCRPGPAACAAGQSCNETTNRCATTCTDDDSDGHDAISCGGDDCDDMNGMRYPGRTEVCDVSDFDEDCDCATYGNTDMDGDGFIALACCNCVGGDEHCGTDCDDRNFSVNPGAADPPGGGDTNCDGVP